MGEAHRIIHNMHGVRAISPDEVYAAICSILAKGSEQTNTSSLVAREHSVLPAK